MKRPVSRIMGLETERLKKPRCMSQVPLGRTGVRHGLDLVIFNLERPAQFFGSLPHLGVTGDKGLPIQIWFGATYRRTIRMWLLMNFATPFGRPACPGTNIARSRGISWPVQD